MFILDFVGQFRSLLFTIDQVAYSLIDNAYNLIEKFANAEFFKDSAVEMIMKNTYIVIGLFALFKIALLLVNALINPDKLFDKEKGFGAVVLNVIIMFALLIFVPILFKESLKIQSTVVRGSYINKLFGLDVVDNYNPGDMFKSQAILALVHPNIQFVETTDGKKKSSSEPKRDGKKYIVDDEYCKDDSTHCKEAIDDYNEVMYGNNKDHMFSTLASHMMDYVKGDFGNGNEKIYVYDYTMLLTFIVGIAITYLLVVFCFDLAERAIKLAILEVISPLFIVTYIDPKSSKSGPFSNWLKEVGSTYVGLYIRLAALALIIILITLWGERNIHLGSWGTIIFILSILIFAKNFPKWLAGLIGVKDFDNGIGGLAKRIGSAAVVGGMLTKAGHGALGIAGGAPRMIAKQIGHRKQLKKQAYENAGLGKGRKNKGARDAWYEENKEKYADMSKKKAIREARKDALLNDTAYSGTKKDKDGNQVPAMHPHLTGLKQLGAATLMGTISGFQTGFKADNAKGAFKGGITAANGLAGDLALETHTGFFGHIGNKIKGLPDTVAESAYGSHNELIDAQKRQKDISTAKSRTERGDYGTKGAGIGEGKVAISTGDKNKINKAIAENTDIMGKLSPSSHEALQYAITQGYATMDKDGKVDFSRISCNKNAAGEIVSYSMLNEDKTVAKTVTVEQLEKNCGGIYDSSSDGAIYTQKAVNDYKNQSLSNYQQNEQLRSQELSNYQTSMTESGKIQSGINGLNAILGGLGLSLDTTNAKAIEKSINEGISSINEKIGKLNETLRNEGSKMDENERKAINQQKANYEGMLSKIPEYQVLAGDGKNAKDMYDATANQSLANIRQIDTAQSSLKPVIDSIGTGTVSELAQTLSIEQKKIESRIEALKPKDNKD